MARKKNNRKVKGKATNEKGNSFLPQPGRGIKKEKTVIIIVCEGETEQNYFNELGVIEAGIRIRIKPELSNKPNWESILTKADEYKIDENTKVYYALDLDCIIDKPQTAKYIQTKKKLIKKDVIPLESYTCFETWLLYHYETNPKSYDKCEKHEKALATYIPNYQKGKGKIYSATKDKLQTACANAKRACKNRESQIKSGVSQESNCTLCFSDVWKLFYDIGLYIPATKKNRKITTIKQTL